MSRLSHNLDQTNPDWRFSYFHAKSLKPGFCASEIPQLCQCCLNIIHKEKIPLCIHTKQLQFLGFGFPLWYTFLKHCAILLLMLIISESCISLYEAIKTNKQFCADYYFPSSNQNKLHQQHFIKARSFKNLHTNQESQSSFDISSKLISNDNFQSKSLLQEFQNQNQQNLDQGKQSYHTIHCTSIFILMSRIDKDIDDLEIVSRISSFIIILCTLIYIRDTLVKTQQYYDQRMCSLSDYSILINGIPQIKGVQKSILQFFNEEFNTPVKIEEMILIPSHQQLQKIQALKKQQLNQLLKLLKRQDDSLNPQIQQIRERLSNLKDQEHKEIDMFKNKIKSDQLLCQQAILVLESEPQKQRVFQQFGSMSPQSFTKYFQDFGMNLKILQAPQPRQIIWQNINCHNSKRYFRVFIGWGLSILFVGCITLIFYFILKWKSHLVQEYGQKKRAGIIVYIALIFVILFNKFVMGKVLHYFTHLEKHATADRQQFSFAFKYSLGMFFTTAIMTLLVEAFTYNNFYLHPYGVIQQQSIMFVMNSFIVPLIWLINPFQIFVLIRRKLNFNSRHLTQRQANQLMQDFQYDMGKRYAEILETVWFTFLYVSLIPMGSFLTLIGVGLYYWVDKYNLLRRSSVHENISGKLSLIAMKLLDAVLVFMPLGQIIFDYYLRSKINNSSIFMLFVGIVYIILPMNTILGHLNEQSFNLEEKTYQQVKHNFKDNYFNLHPIYSKTHPKIIEQSQKMFKQEILKKVMNPIFSFTQGWLMKNERTSIGDTRFLRTQSLSTSK